MWPRPLSSNLVAPGRPLEFTQPSLDTAWSIKRVRFTIGQPELAMITLRLAVPRAVLERLRAGGRRGSSRRVIREILEGGAK